LALERLAALRAMAAMARADVACGLRALMNRVVHAQRLGAVGRASVRASRRFGQPDLEQFFVVTDRFFVVSGRALVPVLAWPARFLDLIRKKHPLQTANADRWLFPTPCEGVRRDMGLELKVERRRIKAKTCFASDLYVPLSFVLFSLLRFHIPI
jgi:hypothetical protein